MEKFIFANFLQRLISEYPALRTFLSAIRYPLSAIRCPLKAKVRPEAAATQSSLIVWLALKRSQTKLRSVNT